MYVCSACLGFIQADDGFPPRWRQAAGEDYFADLECHILSSLINWLIIEQLNQISIASQTYDICRGPIITPPSYKLNSKNYCLSTSLLERNSTLQIRTAGRFCVIASLNSQLKLCKKDSTFLSISFLCHSFGATHLQWTFIISMPDWPPRPGSQTSGSPGDVVPQSQ